MKVSATLKIPLLGDLPGMDVLVVLFCFSCFFFAIGQLKVFDGHLGSKSHFNPFHDLLHNRTDTSSRCSVVKLGHQKHNVPVLSQFKAKKKSICVCVCVCVLILPQGLI